MWNFRALKWIDLRVILIIFSLMIVSLLIISSYSQEEHIDPGESSFWTPLVFKQIQFFTVGWIAFLLAAAFDYSKLREWTWILYLLMILSLIGLFFTPSIQRVHRWYKIPFIGFNFQPSEYAKLSVVISLSWFLERRKNLAESWGTVFLAALVVGIPFLLILKQPDLGTALVLLPITLVIFYFGNIRPSVLKWMSLIGFSALLLTSAIFLQLLPHETLRPYATKVIKEYQFERFNPNSHHQKASITAIGLGGWTGSGWKKSSYAKQGWLPAPYTDSVFPSFGEEFGLLGLIFLIFLFYALIHCIFQVSAMVKDAFGRLLSAGIGVYIAMHVLINIGMMCGFLPITGVPLMLVTYGGSSVIATMTALGIVQSIYIRRRTC